MYKNLHTENIEGIFHITIVREDKLNALNIELLQELKQIVAQVYSDSSIKGAVLSGSGTKAFAAGADIAEFASFTQEEGRNLSAAGHEIFNAIESCPKPFLALVNGFCLGGGCELAMSCHMRIATENAKFGQPEVNLGIIPGYGATQRLPQLIGKAKALELLLTADMISANEALSLGLANHVLATKEEALQKCCDIIQKIATKGSIAVAKVIECVNAGYTKNVNGFDKEIELFGWCMTTEEFKEGTTAFLEKRKAQFNGK